jgi:hypothetical protein
METRKILSNGTLAGFRLSTIVICRLYHWVAPIVITLYRELCNGCTEYVGFGHLTEEI